MLRFSLAAALPLLVVTACAGSNAPSTSGEASDDGGLEHSAAKLTVPTHHRKHATACAPSPRGREPFIRGAADVAGHPFACKTHDDCTARPGGRCVVDKATSTKAPSSACVYDACDVDKDCERASVCVCGKGGGGANACSPPGNCRVDANCASGFCSPAADACGALTGYFCHTADDECHDNKDCSNGDRCLVDVSFVWRCVPVICDGAPP